MLQGLLDQVKRAIFDDPSTPHREGMDPSGLIGRIEGLFGQHQQQGGGGNVRPASEDPLGDPAAQEGFGYGEQPMPRNVRPASEDPLGDPGLIGQNASYGYASPPENLPPNVRPASEDPLGDPADQERYR